MELKKVDWDFDLNLESNSKVNLKQRVKDILVVEHFERSMASSIGSIFVLSFVGILYQFGYRVLTGPIFILGVGIGLATTFRAVLSYLGIKKKINVYNNEKYLKAAVIVNSFLWGLGFCFDAWFSKIDGIERLVALSLMFGFTSVAPVALVTIPRIQGFFYVVCLLFPSSIYIYRFFEGSLPAQAVAIPGFLLILFFYLLSISRRLSKMMVRGVENNLNLQIGRENLESALKKLRETQDKLLTERANALNSQRLAFLGSMASGIAHEINNPLAISGGQVFKIQSYLSKNPQMDPSGFINSCAQKISNVNLRIQNVVRGLQYFARESTNEDNKVFSLNELMDFTASFFKEKMKMCGIQFELETVPNVSLDGQKNQLSRALFNIVENAIEAVQGMAEPKIIINSKVEGTQILIQIIDNGRGLTEEVKEQMFFPFFTTKDVGQGTGLGLSVSLGIIRAHKGDIQCASLPGSTIFSINLPFATDKSKEGSAA